MLFLPALHLETGKRTVMHLVARENLPEPATQGNNWKSNNYYNNVFI